jgi:tetratricopeptide (TPR) repeat protein
VARLIDLARTAYAAGRLEDARDACQERLSIDGADKAALDLLGQIYITDRRFDEAASCFMRSVAVDPDNTETLAMLGTSLLAAGKPHQAADALARAARISPSDPLLHHRLGRALELLGDDLAAMECQNRAIAAAPTFLPAHRELGLLLEKTGRFDQALKAFDAALRLQADDGGTHYNRGVVLLGLRRFEDAGAAFRRALELGRETATTHNNLGLSLQRGGQLAEAAEQFRRAVQLDRSLAAAWLNLGNVLQEQGDVHAAIHHYLHAVEIDPAGATARANLALAYLTCGDFARGWPLFNARLLVGARQSSMHAPTNVPLWDGQIGGSSQRDIILVTEQGFGDTIQFVRYGVWLAERGFRPVLQCHPRLRRLLASAKGFVDIVPDGSEYPSGRFVWYPLLSVPAILGPNLQSIPSATPYLAAEPDLVTKWRTRLGGGRFRIGIAWQGNLQHEQESLRGRSVPLDAFGQLMGIPGITWICLQKGTACEQLTQLPWGNRIQRYDDDLDTGPDAFHDTAAIITSLDLVITSDTSIAHLAGALGCPTWIALSRMPDWRWLLDRADSPWYPTVRLFRQPNPGDWHAVLREMSVLLSARATGLDR